MFWCNLSASFGLEICRRPVGTMLARVWVVVQQFFLLCLLPLNHIYNSFLVFFPLPCLSFSEVKFYKESIPSNAYLISEAFSNFSYFRTKNKFASVVIICLFYPDQGYLF